MSENLDQKAEYYIRCNDTENYKLLLLNKEYDPSSFNYLALIQASQYGHMGIVKLLLNDSRIKDNINDGVGLSISYAIIYKNNEIVKLLLNEIIFKEPSKVNSFFLTAVENGNFDIVKLLFKNPNINPSANNNYAINSALNKGFIKIIDLLWNDIEVQNKVKKNDFELYQTLTKNRTKEKLKTF
jgi:ankyrin repeat protein